MKRFKIELLSTADGYNFGTKEQRKKSMVVVLVWCESKKEAEEVAEKIAEALFRATHVGNIEYMVKSVKDFSKHPAAIHI